MSRESREREQARRDEPRVIVPGGQKPSQAEVEAAEALNVPESLCPIMSTTVFLPNPLTNAIELRGVNRPCNRQCMLYEPAVDLGNGPGRGSCKLSTAARTRVM